MDNVDLDLDQIGRTSKKIKLNGKIFEIFTPEFQHLIRLQKLLADLRAVKADNLTEEESTKALKDFQTAFNEIIPEIKNEKLTVKQLTVLFGYVMQMGTPTNAELPEGVTYDPVTPDNMEKKSLNSSELLPSSSDSTPDTPTIS